MYVCTSDHKLKSEHVHVRRGL